MKFKWKVEGSRPTMTMVEWPPWAFFVLLSLFVAVISYSVTTKESDQEKAYNAAQSAYEKEHPR